MAELWKGCHLQLALALEAAAEEVAFLVLELQQLRLRVEEQLPERADQQRHRLATFGTGSRARWKRLEPDGKGQRKPESSNPTTQPGPARRWKCEQLQCASGLCGAARWSSSSSRSRGCKCPRSSWPHQKPTSWSRTSCSRRRKCRCRCWWVRPCRSGSFAARSSKENLENCFPAPPGRRTPQGWWWGKRRSCTHLEVHWTWWGRREARRESNSSPSHRSCKRLFDQVSTKLCSAGRAQKPWLRNPVEKKLERSKKLV